MSMFSLFQLNAISKYSARARQVASKQPRLGHLLSLLTLVLFLVGCGGTTPATPASSGPAPVNVNFVLDYLPNANDTGIYVAQAKGGYKQQGINVNILPYSNNVSPEQLVSSGEADFAVSFAESLVQDRALGQPLVSVAAIFQHDTTGVVTLKSSGLDSIAKLAGKTYAGNGTAWEPGLISQILSCRGASNGKFQNVTTSTDPVSALQSGKFNFAIMEQGYGVVQEKFRGIELNVFPFNDNCVPDVYEIIIIGNEPFLKAHPDVARRFMAATAQGYTYAAQHAQEAATILFAASPQGDFSSQQEAQASQAVQSAKSVKDGKWWGQQTVRKATE